VVALGLVAKVSFDLKQTMRTREERKARSEWRASQAAIDCGRARENRGWASSTPQDYRIPTPVPIANNGYFTQIVGVKLRFFNYQK
jgi:hypothetical protein